MIQDTNGKTYATAALFMAELRRKAKLRDERTTPAKDVQPREVTVSSGPAQPPLLEEDSGKEPFKRNA